MSPATSRPSTRKHWLPGVWPGVWIISTPTCADLQHVATVVGHESVAADTGGPLDPGHLVGLDVDRHLHLLEQRADPLERPAAHLPAEMIRMEVGAQHTGESHAVGRQDVEQVLHGVGGVDRHRLAGLAVADQIDEVDHLAGHHVALGEVATGEQLPEIEPVVCTAPGRSCRAVNHSCLLLPRAGHVAGQRIEPGHQLLDLGLGPAQAPVELVDQGRGPFQPADEHVHVDLALLEEVHDGVELTARLREAQLLAPGRIRPGRSCVSSCLAALVTQAVLPPCGCPDRLPPGSRTVPSAKRVTISCCSASAPALRTSRPSAVRVRL